jgi:hypothetical protein
MPTIQIEAKDSTGNVVTTNVSYIVDSGVPVTSYQAIPGTARFSAKLATLPDNSRVSLPVGIIENEGWTDGGGDLPYAFLVSKQSEIVGQGPDNTILRIRPGSSAKEGWYENIARNTAYTLNTQRCTAQNGWVMICVQAGTTGPTAPAAWTLPANNALPNGTLSGDYTDGTVIWRTYRNTIGTTIFAAQSNIKLLQDFSVVATELGHIYNGFRVNQSTLSPVLRRIKVKGIRGTNGGNPGETFSLNLWRCPGATVEDCEVDGRNDAGTVVAYSLLGLNNNDNTTVNRSYFHHARAGVAAWQTNNITYNGTRCEDLASRGFAHERCGGTIILNKVTALRCTGSHAKFDSDLGSAKVMIIDPIFDGPKFRVTIHDTYLNGQKQLKSDIKLYMNGVERPDLLQFQNT